MWPFIRYWLYVGHRWLGVGGCLLFAIWFVSGIVMTLVGYPALDETARRAALRPIEWSQVTVTPNELLAALPLDRYPNEFALEMLLDRPVYRIKEWDGSLRTISARKIENVGAIDAQSAIKIAADYAKAPATLLGTIARDQWTVPEGYGALRPLHKLAIDDTAGTQIYVSSMTGEIALVTTRSQRFWNWLGSVPHWIYFTDLRANQPVWRQVNLWLSGPAILVAISGIWIGILRLRVRSRYPHGTLSPYHSWKWWHHWLGIVGGFFLFTWILSGWFSVNPNQWFSGGWWTAEQWLAHSGHKGLTHDAQLPALSRPDAKRVQFYYIAGEPLVRITTSQGEQVLDSRTMQAPAFTDERLFASVATALPNHRLIVRERVEKDDLYWYSHHLAARPLPVLRAVFDDPGNSWFYLEPKSGEIIDFSDDGVRRYRWWFNAIHRWDFSWLLKYQPLWYGTMWTLALAGLVVSVSGVVIGWQRVRRKLGSR